MCGKIFQTTVSVLSKIFCAAVFLLHASFTRAQESTAADEALQALMKDYPKCFDASATYFDDDSPCFLIFQGAHHNWIFIEAEVADRVQLLDSLGRLHPLREPVAPLIIPIPNAPPMLGEKYPSPLHGYGVYATPDIPH